MKFIKLSLAAAVLATGMLAAETSEIGISANMALTSNYIWRGMTQTADAPSIQGGIDLDYAGIYAGVWAANVRGDNGGSLETDFYLGYANELGNFSYDLGAIQYAYPKQTVAANFAEVYASVGYDFGMAAVGATYSKGLDTATDNVEATVSVPLPAEIGLDLAYGIYNDIGTYYSASVAKSFGKFDISVAYTAIAMDSANVDANNIVKDDESNVVATIGTSF